MIPTAIVPAIAALSLLAGSANSVEYAADEAQIDLEPAINGSVSASGLFPTQALEDEFTAYLRWTKEEGLSRLVAFETDATPVEPAADGAVSASGRFPTQSMEDQFVAYNDWVSDTGISPFYAFSVTDFD
jgi:hypothetical protein